jgi:conjugal transfer pilus assembly protein TraV
MRMSPIIAALGLMPLAGCSMFHSNVKGGFVCSAPRGTCAPSTTIDDSAIHAIDAEAEAKDAPPTPDAEPAANGSQASTNPKEKKAWTFVGPARPVLKIVYMPWRDGSGRLHPRTTGFVPIDAPHLAEASSAPLDAKAMGTGQDMSLLTLAEMAPDMALMAPATTKAPEGGKPTPALPTDPTAAIKDKVKAILNQHQAQPNPPKPSAPQPAPPTSAAATFPPQGTDAPCSPGSSNSSPATARRPSIALKRAMFPCSPASSAIAPMPPRRRSSILPARRASSSNWPRSWGPMSASATS